MFLFFAFWIAGVALRFLIAWGSGKFDIKQNAIHAIVAVAVGVFVSWLFKSMNLGGWLSEAIMVAAGFMSKYCVEWLDKQKG